MTSPCPTRARATASFVQPLPSVLVMSVPIVKTTTTITMVPITATISTARLLPFRRITSPSSVLISGMYASCVVCTAR